MKDYTGKTTIWERVKVDQIFCRPGKLYHQETFLKIDAKRYVVLLWRGGFIKSINQSPVIKSDTEIIIVET